MPSGIQMVDEISVRIRTNMKMNLRILSSAIVAALAATLGLGTGQSAFAAIELIPHRAVYGMNLHSAQRGSGITGARGNMIYGFQIGRAHV